MGRLGSPCIPGSEVGMKRKASKFMIGHAFEALGIQRVSLTSKVMRWRSCPRKVVRGDRFSYGSLAALTGGSSMKERKGQTGWTNTGKICFTCCIGRMVPITKEDSGAVLNRQVISPTSYHVARNKSPSPLIPLTPHQHHHASDSN